MKYVAIDIETTGLDSEVCQILQVGAVIEDTVLIPKLEDLPRFSCIVEYPTYTGRPFALDMNNWILKILASLERANKDERVTIRKEHHIMRDGLVARALYEWLRGNGIQPVKDSKSEQVQINVAGKNFATFDRLFLEKLPGWSTLIQVKQRIIDPAVIFTDWQEDESLPNLNTCIKRAGLTGEVTHDAVQDAVDVVRVLRAVTSYYEKRFYV
jgi:oligoribonuclease